jgi:hypothetical protein
MPGRLIAVALLLFVKTQTKAGEKDYLQRGEEKLNDKIEIKYDRAVRDVLSRAWRTDVVLRMVDIPPFQSEWVTGITRSGDHYHAFEVTASKHIWSVLGFGGGKKGDYHSIHPNYPRASDFTFSSGAHLGAMGACAKRLAKLRNGYGDVLRYRPIHLLSQLHATRTAYG